MILIDFIEEADWDRTHGMDVATNVVIERSPLLLNVHL